MEAEILVASLHCLNTVAACLTNCGFGITLHIQHITQREVSARPRVGNLRPAGRIRPAMRNRPARDISISYYGPPFTGRRFLLSFKLQC